MVKLFSFLFRNNISILKTLTINLRMFPLSTALKIPIYVCRNWQFVELKGTFEIKSPVRRGMIVFGVNIASYVQAPKGTLKMKEGSKIIFTGTARISQGCQLYLNNNAILIIHNDVKFGDNAKLICYSKIEIGELSELTWESQITDFNSHFIENIETGQIINIIKPVQIGNRCWIGNRTSIMPGTVLPDNLIVASNSLLNKDYYKAEIRSYSLIGGLPAKLIKENVRRIYSLEHEKVLFNYFNSVDNALVNSDILTGKLND